jgi:hypothetical protein
MQSSELATKPIRNGRRELFGPLRLLDVDTTLVTEIVPATSSILSALASIPSSSTAAFASRGARARRPPS